ncbi:MAG: HTTM domain-containing protein [Proteobacteria bacterium]|nr:HTTM domain-containing protein [Pseudomonadota bacterium]
MAKRSPRGKRPPATSPSPPSAPTTPPASQKPATSPKMTPAPTVAPAPSPKFWFGFEVSWAKLAIGRVVLFGLLAADALLAIRHAPRYGAGGFNVAQLAGLDGLGPTHASYAITQLGLAYLFVLAACGIATRYVVPIAAAGYAWLYFGSQLDSYQHHYLVVMLLVIGSAIPWQRPAGATARTPVRSWALRLFLVQLAILYLWAAISKMTPAWLDGRTLAMQIVTAPDRMNLRGAIDATIGMATLSKLVLVTELGLAATLCWKRAWPIVAPVGVLFHLGIVLSKFDIGLFAWLMIGIYGFVVPDRIWIALAEWPPIRVLGRLGRVITGAGWIVAGVLVLGALGLAMLVRLPYATGMATLIVGVSIGAAYSAQRFAATPQARVAKIGAAALLATGLWGVVDRGSDVATDYYRFWGGSSRRLGDLASAERAYRELVAIAPDEPVGHFQLGRLLLDKDPVAGLAHLRTAQHLEPSRARAYLAEARYLAKQGTAAAKAQALDKAREGTFAEPSSSEARALVDQLTKGTLATPAQDDP